MGKQNLYEILDVPSNAPQDEIHRAYLRSKSTYSNDNPAMYTMFTKEEATEILKMVEEAYLVLSNFEARKKYDLQVQQDSQVVSADNSMETLSDFTDLSLSKLENSAQQKQNEEQVSAQTAVSNMVAQQAKMSTLPEGYVRTKFGMYEQDPIFEEEIERTQFFDGEFLKKIRMYKKIDVNQISEVTKISANYFIAIESDNYECLPAPVFVRGFLVQYSKALGLDPDKVAKSYLQKMKEA
ncbi:helix-turn-helix domain-containing protein [bacterium]|nr:helix-turn-helix domain-containing protein [bacterium]